MPARHTLCPFILACIEPLHGRTEFAARRQRSGLEAARREKLHKIRRAGHRPLGRALRRPPADRRNPRPGRRNRRRAGRAPAEPAAEQHGPKVRAAGRIVLRRPSGKVHWLHLRDWTGTIQVMIGKTQVGEANWALAAVPRPGRHRRRRRRAEADQDRRADDLRRGPALPDQVARHAAGEAQGPGRPRAAAADALPRPDPHRGRAGAVPAADEDRPVDPQHAGRPRASSRSKGRRCTPSPAGRPPGRLSPTTTPWTSTSICGSPWSCT